MAENRLTNTSVHLSADTKVKLVLLKHIYGKPLNVLLTDLIEEAWAKCENDPATSNMFGRIVNKEVRQSLSKLIETELHRASPNKRT